MKYRKKPVVIEAMQFRIGNGSAIKEFCPTAEYDAERAVFVISTLEGDMTAADGDWIIKGVEGEFYPCKPDIFEQTYEEV